MSGFGGSVGGRTSHASPVLVNVYNLSPLNAPLLNHAGVGVHHSGVEVCGVEYSFAGGAGVFEDAPKQAQGAEFSHAIPLGDFEGGASDVRAAVGDMREEFGPDAYNVLLRNCNHFADAFCRRLLGKGIPG